MCPANPAFPRRRPSPGLASLRSLPEHQRHGPATSVQCPRLPIWQRSSAPSPQSAAAHTRESIDATRRLQEARRPMLWGACVASLSRHSSGWSRFSVKALDRRAQHGNTDAGSQESGAMRTAVRWQRAPTALADLVHFHPVDWCSRFDQPLGLVSVSGPQRLKQRFPEFMLCRLFLVGHVHARVASWRSAAKTRNWLRPAPGPTPRTCSAESCRLPVPRDACHHHNGMVSCAQGQTR